MEPMPVVEVWPVCVSTKPLGRYAHPGADARPCNTPYILRLVWSGYPKQKWIWMRDCKHKRGPVQPHNADGPCGELKDL
jgi:hypothetical protein